ncbi:MAG: hypothetical protein CL926_11225 [Deltaproteobacteria bacterium]|jgi:hypothetical protein|nr:hypothetical protein [Deltaproteobacteria bacterium]|tara:strand:- start:497 stop:1411 length:915 start_codon:yes stop_codon:yes gene_type:complete
MKKPAISLQKITFTLILVASVLLGLNARASTLISALDKEQFDWLGQRIFINECAGQLRCLTSWNDGEDFPSMGIGHFIWYQSGQEAPFEETFPALLAFLQRAGVSLPNWLFLSASCTNAPTQIPGCDISASELPLSNINKQADSPWKSRQEFLADIEGVRLSGLRRLLQNTLNLQVEFILERFELTLQEILNQSSPIERELLKTKIDSIANAQPPYGQYALIDYLHFKGAGVLKSEKYNGQGWGLLQLLKALPESQPTLLDYVETGEMLLRQRVANAPIERDESRWIKGWIKRLRTYLPPPEVP